MPHYTHNPYTQKQQQPSALAAAFAAPPSNKAIYTAAPAEMPPVKQQQQADLSDNQAREQYVESLMQSAYDLHATHQSTLHRDLIGRVSFIPYPTESLDDSFFEGQAANAPTSDTEDPLVRIFIGQLPYRVTEMQLQWMFRIFALGAQIYSPERITKKSKTIGATRVPTGCIHAHLRESNLKCVLQNMHKRLLIDDSGIFFARDDAEKDSLDGYVAMLKAEPHRRFPERPYDSLVVQEAVSSFQAPNPRWVSNTPEMERFAQTMPPANNNNNNNAQQQQHGYANNHQQLDQCHQVRAPQPRYLSNERRFGSYPQHHQQQQQQQQYYHHQQPQYNNNNNAPQPAAGAYYYQ